MTPSSIIVRNLVHVGLAAGTSALLIVLLHVQERAVGRFLAHRLGWRSVLVTGWLGVPLHELSHLAAAALFGHRIVAYKLFDADPVTGTLGYVRHAYRRRSPWQVLGGLVIGLAPLVAGMAALGALLLWMIPGSELAQLAARTGAVARETRAAALPGLLWPLLRDLLEAIWTHRSAALPLQLYLCVCVASHMSPSRADLTGALPGALLLLLLLGGAVAASPWIGVDLAGIELVPLLLGLCLASSALFQGLYVATVAAVGRLRGGSSPAVQRQVR